MSTKTFIENFQTNQKITEVFYVSEKSLKSSRNGRPYLDLVLKDRTGSIVSKIWENVEKLSQTFSKGDFVKVAGIIQEYQDKPQLKIDIITPVEAGKVDKTEFVDSLGQDKVEKYWTKLTEYMDEIKDPHIKKLMDSFFKDPEFQIIFMDNPAARHVHHDMLGGLLKHTFTMLAIGRFLAKIYRDINYDLLAAGIVLHDIGKVRELITDVAIEYSDEGKLLSHSIIGLMMVREKINGIEGFPEKTAQLLEHIIISHHGKPEFGAMKIPLFKEAMLVHLIDSIDSRMEIMDKQYRKMDEGDLWSEKCWAIDNQSLLRIDRFLDAPRDSSGFRNSGLQQENIPI